MFEGVHVALVTPFSNGKVDVEKIGELVEFQIAKGTNGIVPCGTTGESATLNHEEHKTVIRTVTEKVAGRAKVIAGTGSNSTSEAVAFTRYAKEVGCDGALVITPYYNKPPQHGLYQHFTKVAESAPDLPIVLYNVPGRTGVDMLPDTVQQLAELDSIVAIKEATGSLDRTSDILMRTDKITVVSGDDALTLPLMSVGAKGVISVLANLDPTPLLGVVKAHNAGDVAEAIACHRRLYPIAKAMFIDNNPMAVKTGMMMQGRINGEMRQPLCAMTDEGAAQLKKVLTEAGLL